MLEFQRRLSAGFYALVSLPATAMGYALCVQISALSWILSTKYDLDETDVGFVWAAGPIAGIIGQVLIGVISDKVWFWGGRRRPFIWIGGIIAGLMMFLLPRMDLVADAFGLATIVPVALFVALALDLAINVGFNPTRSLIADTTPEGKARTNGFTWMQTISGLFGVGAYFIGAAIDNYALIWSGIILVPLFTVVPTLFIKEPRETAQDKSLEPREVRKTEHGQLIRIYLAHAFTWFGVQTMFVFLFFFVKDKFRVPDDAPILTEEELGQIVAWAFLVLNSVGALLPGLVLAPLAQRWGRVPVHIACLAMMSVGYFSMVWFVESTPLFYFLMGVVGVGWAATVSLPFAIFSEKVSKDKMGTHMGIFNLSVVIPQLLVSLILGGVIETAPDKALMFTICGGSLSISAILWVLVKEKRSAGEEIPQGDS